MPGISIDFCCLRRGLLPRSTSARLHPCALAALVTIACAACSGDVDEPEDRASRDTATDSEDESDAVERALYDTWSDTAAAPFSNYLALGDSFSAGLDRDWSLLACEARSASAWPNLLFRDFISTGNRWEEGFRACSGATTADLPGQYPTMTDRFAGADTLITVTIGGNDIGVSEEVARCLDFDCVARRTAIAEKIEQIAAPNLRKAFADLRRTFPSATIVAVGYPFLLAEQSNCNGVTPAEATMIREAISHMNSVIASEAKDAGISSVIDEVVEAFSGHEMCSVDPYIGITFHPTEAGHEVYSAAVGSAIFGLPPRRIAAVDPSSVSAPESEGTEAATPSDSSVASSDSYDEQAASGDESAWYDEQDAWEDETAYDE